MTISLRSKMKPLVLILASVSLLAVVACSGDPGTGGGDGAPGQNGRLGSAGVAGVAGADGIQGIPGIPGPLGDEGPRGARGPSGAQGPEGVAGAVGTDGSISASLTITDSGSGNVGVVDLSNRGTKVDVTGAGFSAGESVNISIGGTGIIAVTADPSGVISAMGLTLPSSLSEGDVVSVRGDGTAGTTGWGALLVTNKNSLN